MDEIRIKPIFYLLLTRLFNCQLVAVVSRFIEFADGFYGILVVLKIDERVFILHHDVSDCTAGVEDFFKIIGSGASGDACDINLCEIWVVRFCSR